MSELIWFNGEILPLSEARVGVEDRGYQFADGVYEVVRVYHGRPFTLQEHLERLDRSAKGILINPPLPIGQLSAEMEKLVAKNKLQEGMIYAQLTRGVAPRNHIFSDCKPTLLFYTRPLPPVAAPGAAAGVKLHSVADERWKRCWIKSIALLPNVLAKNLAVAHGADEAVFVEDGCVSECSASNFFAIAGGKLITHSVGPKVLPGITRLVLLQLAKELDIEVVERPLSEAEAIRADELFITSTTRELGWVSHWNGQPLTTHCGPLTLRLHQAYQQRVARDTR